ncbi:Endoribonuclease L-PSP/chorismate mutase-like protein [Coprinopsis sp. MPI-PUGE-AT-0042]|nr:Endoribonuclease L-PSP/chorismate mutase-like protein [Coprinopsis sp. MPI-PUGE-AT-0042]
MPTAAQVVRSQEAVPPIPVFSQAVVSKGIVYASGSIGVTADWKLVEGGIKEQTRAALQNLEKVLKAANSGFELIVKCNIFITDFKEFSDMNEVYAEFFPNKIFPARTCVGVASLPLGAAVEIECVAEVSEFWNQVKG